MRTELGYFRRSVGTRGVTRRQISRGGRTSSKITGEARPADSSRALSVALLTGLTR